MIDIQDFMECEFGYRPSEMWTVEQYERYLAHNNCESLWSFPLEEYSVVADNEKEYGTVYKAVRFKSDILSYGDGYEYRFCETLD